jgi:hypothetical protein
MKGKILYRSIVVIPSVFRVDNAQDAYAVAAQVTREDELTTVGHIPREIS